MKGKVFKILILISLIIAYRVLLDYAYEYLVQPNYSYWGYANNASQRTSIVSWILMSFGIFLTLPYYRDRGYVVANCVLVLFFVGFVPFTSYIKYNPQSDYYIFCNSIYWFLFFLVTRLVKIRSLRLRQAPKSVIFIIGLIFSLVVIFISGYYTHFRFTISLLDVYDLREESRGFDMPIILVYLWSASRVVLPIFVTYYLLQKKYIWAVFFILIVLLNFSIDGMKSVLFSLIICLVLFFFVKKDLRNYYPILFASLIILALVEYELISTTFISDSLIRRNFVVPADLDTRYFAVTEEFGPRFWSYSVNGQNVAFYIGDQFFDRPDMRANNGMFSDAYLNLGLIGCFIYPFIYAYMFQIADSLLKNTNRGLVLLVCFLWAYKMRGAIFTTVLLTHGIAISILVMSLMPLKSKDN